MREREKKKSKCFRWHLFRLVQRNLGCLSELSGLSTTSTFLVGDLAHASLECLSRGLVSLLIKRSTLEVVLPPTAAFFTLGQGDGDWVHCRVCFLHGGYGRVLVLLCFSKAVSTFGAGLCEITLVWVGVRGVGIEWTRWPASCECLCPCMWGDVILL